MARIRAIEGAAKQVCVVKRGKPMTSITFSDSRYGKLLFKSDTSIAQHQMYYE